MRRLKTPEPARTLCLASYGLRLITGFCGIRNTLLVALTAVQPSCWPCILMLFLELNVCSRCSIILMVAWILCTYALKLLILLSFGAQVKYQNQVTIKALLKSVCWDRVMLNSCAEKGLLSRIMGVPCKLSIILVFSKDREISSNICSSLSMCLK